MGRQAYHGLTMEQLSKSLSQSLFENHAELRELERRAGGPRPSKAYLPNGKREIERRLRQMERRKVREITEQV